MIKIFAFVSSLLFFSPFFYAYADNRGQCSRDVLVNGPDSVLCGPIAYRVVVSTWVQIMASALHTSISLGLPWALEIEVPDGEGSSAKGKEYALHASC